MHVRAFFFLFLHAFMYSLHQMGEWANGREQLANLPNLTCHTMVWWHAGGTVANSS